MSLVQTTIHVLLLLTPEVYPLSDIRFSEVNLWGGKLSRNSCFRRLE